MKTIPMPVLVALLITILILMFLKRPTLAIVVDSAIIGGLIFGGLWELRGIIGGAVAFGTIAALLADKFLAIR